MTILHLFSYFIFHERARHQTMCITCQFTSVHICHFVIFLAILRHHRPIVTKGGTVHVDSPPYRLASYPSNDSTLNAVSKVVFRSWITCIVGLVESLVSYCLFNLMVIKKFMRCNSIPSNVAIVLLHVVSAISMFAGLYQD